MRTELAPGARAGRAAALLAATLSAAALAPGVRAEEGAGSAEGAGKPGADWESWRADNDVSDTASRQRGARNFVSYCLGCHSLKYERWSRLGQDLAIPQRLLQTDLLPPGDPPTEYIRTSMPAADAQSWFGKTPPDLALMARARRRLSLSALQDLLRRPGPANRRQQPALAQHRHAARALGARGAQARRVPRRGPARRGWHGNSRAGVRSLRADRTGASRRRGVRRLRARHGELPRLRRRADADRAPRSRHMGGAVSAGVQLARLAGETRVLEGCPLILGLGAGRGAPP